MSAPRAKVRRGQPRATGECVTHRGDRRSAQERHVGERDEVSIRRARGARGAREARAHPLRGFLADGDFASRLAQGLAEFGTCGSHDRDDARELELEMARRLHGNRDAVGQRVTQLVGAEARSGSRREEQPDDIQVCFTSQADGSKRRSGFAAHDGSFTPWRTAVISARIATAISGGVFEPI